MFCLGRRVQANASTLFGAVSLVVGLVLYLVAVTGAFFAEATPPADIGLVSTTAVFVLFGLGGLAMGRLQTATSEQS